MRLKLIRSYHQEEQYLMTLCRLHSIFYFQDSIQHQPSLRLSHHLCLPLLSQLDHSIVVLKINIRQVTILTTNSHAFNLRISSSHHSHLHSYRIEMCFLNDLLFIFPTVLIIDSLEPTNKVSELRSFYTYMFFLRCFLSNQSTFQSCCSSTI